MSATRTPNARALQLAAMSSDRGFRQACKELRAKLDRPLTEDELRRVDQLLREIRTSQTVEVQTLRPNLDVAKAFAARCANQGRPVPAFYQSVIDEADAAESASKAEADAAEVARKAAANATRLAGLAARPSDRSGRRIAKRQRTASRRGRHNKRDAA